MRGQDHVRQAAQHRAELLAAALGLLGEHVDGGAGDVAAFDVPPQRLVVDDEAAGQVQEQAARLHRGELGVPEQPAVTGPSVHVQGDGLHGFEQLGKSAAAARIPQGQLVGDVVEVHRHAQVLGQHGQLGADVAVADDAEPAAADLVAAGCGLVPLPRVHLGVLLRQPPGQRDDLREHQLDDTAGVGERRVEHRDTAARRGGEVDLVDADAERADRGQARRRREDPLGDVRAGADAEQAEIRAAPRSARLRSAHPCASPPRSLPWSARPWHPGGCSPAAAPASAASSCPASAPLSPRGHGGARTVSAPGRAWPPDP